ncbi:MAG: hypothetical protein MUE36_09180 [Acidimicrobiales bacterium]|jgi:hypothetical protein|nr:hypothetical protein [Acidimicrobiales bacterium]
MTTTTARPSAVRLHPAFDRPDEVLASIRAVDEWWPLARYAGSENEVKATGGDAGATMFVPPWFRRDVALGGRPLVPGAEAILDNRRFVEGARTVFGGDVEVRPATVYVNVMLPGPVPFVPHLDVPAFRGFTRADHPVWLLHQMTDSGLFDHFRIRLATAVWWSFAGPGGAFHYWPRGPEATPESIEPPFDNVAVLADNERTYHGVAPVGTRDDSLLEGLTRESLLHRVDGGWEIRTGGDVVASASDGRVRITVSWKGEIHSPEEPDDELDLDTVVETFLADLRRRGVDAAEPDDAHHDDGWVATLSGTYGRRPPRVPR